MVTLAALVVAVAALVGVGPTAASAAPGPATPKSHIRAGMTLVGFDAKIAKAHGYKIVTYADGSQQSVPVNSKDKTKKKSPILRPGAKGAVKAAAVNQDTVYGDCGWSYIEGEVIGTHKVWVRSGLGGGPAAVDEAIWRITLADKNGQSYQGANGSSATNSWSHTWPSLNQYGWSQEWVLEGQSYAWYTDGSLCYAGEPFIQYYVSY